MIVAFPVSGAPNHRFQIALGERRPRRLTTVIACAPGRRQKRACDLRVDCCAQRGDEATTRDDVIVLISETKSLLTSMLDLAGVRHGQVSAADVLTTVEVFRQFATVPVDDAVSPEEDGDGVLAQTGTFDFDGVRQFYADLTR
ncbi:hypothetical protein [Actinoplanes sp. NPDC051411]|uniref:hypothetical protein n=1 Tax=Actinoplanes sp. NPDC051411 TaxID=3155522 RepID=UPI0034288669